MDDRQGKYAQGKAEAERIIFAGRHLKGRRLVRNDPMRRTALRTYHVVGKYSLLGCAPPTNRLPLLCDMIRNGERIPLPDGGRIPLQFVNPIDIGKVVCRIFDDKRTYGQAYNLVHPTVTDIASYYLCIARALGKKLEYKSVPAERFWASRSGWNLTLLPHIYDTKKLRGIVGGMYMPSIGLEKSVREAIDNPPTVIGPIDTVPVHRRMTEGRILKDHPSYALIS